MGSALHNVHRDRHSPLCPWSGQSRSRPKGSAAAAADNVMVKALARAFRWRKQLDEDAYATIEELAKSSGFGVAMPCSQPKRLSRD